MVWQHGGNPVCKKVLLRHFAKVSFWGPAWREVTLENGPGSVSVCVHLVYLFLSSLLIIPLLCCCDVKEDVTRTENCGYGR